MTVAFLWALAWLPVGIAFDTYEAAASPSVLGPGAPWMAITWAAWGCFSGAAFAIVLAVAEAGRTLLQLSLFRSALWGALGSLTLPTAIMAIDVLSGHAPFTAPDAPVLSILALSAVLGGACAAGTVTLVRRAPVN